MKILAAETSSPQGSLALIDSKNLIDEVSWSKSNSHSEIITEKCIELLKRNNTKITDIDCFATGIGPGSFTGIRVAMNFAKTCAFAQHKKLFSKNTFELYSAPLANEYDQIRVVIFAFRNLVYSCAYEVKDGVLIETESPNSLEVDQFLSQDHTKYALCGDLYLKFPQALKIPCKAAFPSQKPVLASSFQYFHREYLDQGVTSQPETLTPLYVRASEAEEKLGKS